MLKFLNIRMRCCAMVVLGLLLLAQSLCSAQARSLKIVTSFFPVYCFTENVSMGLAQVDNLLPAGVGPHDYQFRPKDMQKLREADLIILNGLSLESWLEDALTNRIKKLSEAIIRITSGLDAELLKTSEESKAEADHSSGHGHEYAIDPHIWLDPVLARHAVEVICAALQKADPEHATAYGTNASNYLKKLDQLHMDYQKELTPLKSRAFVTYHRAFGYLVKRYELKCVGVVEETPDVDPSPRYLSRLTQTMKDTKARIIFTEPQYSGGVAETMSRDLGIKTGVLDTFETGAFKASAYEDGMRLNLKRLRDGLN